MAQEFKPGMLSFCAHCFSQVYDAVKHLNETGHARFIHDGEFLDLSKPLPVDLPQTGVIADPPQAKVVDPSPVTMSEALPEADKPV